MSNQLTKGTHDMPELQTPEVEQLMHETMSNLKKLQTLFVWDFEKAVSDIAWLGRCHVEKEEEDTDIETMLYDARIGAL